MSSLHTINQSVLDNPTSESQILTELVALRKNLAPAKALIATYSFDPLIGMTSQTDTNSQTKWFYYDSNGRLSLIKDQNGDIVTQHEYNFVVK